MEREKAIRIGIAAGVGLAVMIGLLVLINLVNAVVPIVIITTGIFAGYRFYNSELVTPKSTEEVEQEAQSWWSRLRRGKKTVEKAAKIGGALIESQMSEETQAEKVVEADDEGDEEEYETFDPEPTDETAAAEANLADPADEDSEMREQQIEERATRLDRLEDQLKDEPTVNDSVLSQIEERKRRLLGSEDES